MDTDIFIYGLFDPRGQTLFYVGKTQRGSKEPEQYIAQSGKGSTARPVKRYLRRLFLLGLKATWEILEDATEQNLNTLEVFWISSLRAAGANLTNVTDGGDGVSFVPEDVRKKIGQSLREHPRRLEIIEKRAASNRGQKRSDKTRTRISERTKGRISHRRGHRYGRWEFVECTGCSAVFEKLFRRGKSSATHFHSKRCQLDFYRQKKGLIVEPPT